MNERISPVLAMKISLGLCALLSVVVGLPYALALFGSSSGEVVQTDPNDQDAKSLVNSQASSVAGSELGITTTQAALLTSVALSLVLCAAFAFYLIPLLIAVGRQEAEVDSQNALRSLREHVAKYEKEIKSLRDREDENNTAVLANEREWDEERRKLCSQKKKLEDECSLLKENQRILAGKIDTYKQKEKMLESTQLRQKNEQLKFDEKKVAFETELKSREASVTRLKQEEKQLQNDVRDLESQLNDLKLDLQQRKAEKAVLEQEQSELELHIEQFNSRWSAIESFESNKAQHEEKLADLKAEVEFVDQALREKRFQLQELQDKEDSTKKLCEELEVVAKEGKLEADRQKQDAQRRLDLAVERENAVADLERRLKQQETQQQEEAIRLSQKAHEIEKDLAAAASERKDAQNTRQKTAIILASNDARLKEISDFRSNNWPSWCISGSLTPTIDELEGWARGGNAFARLLLSNLQVLNALESHNELGKDFKYIGPTVRELGRFLAQALALQGCSADDSSRILVDWSKAINQSFAGKCRLSVPAIGSAFDPLEMQSLAGPIKTVAKVHNWSIINSRAITEMKAEVS